MNDKLKSQIKRQISQAKIVSFDIFDTLLVRPYVKPTDLFKHMEKHYGIPGFAEHRISAELKAREKIHPDVTLDDIYNEIDNKYKSLKEKELQWEKMVLRPNPFIADIYNFAKSAGKEIIIASDMYLPTEFIQQILTKNNFTGYNRLYVSGDLGITKENGTMYEAIIRATNVNPNKILHICDNRHSDFTVPRSYGIKSILIPKIFNQYLEQSVRAQRFFETHKHNVGSSILLSMIAIHKNNNITNNYWAELGYEYCGPTVYGYTKWIEGAVKRYEVNNLFFIARDGYTLHRVFNMFNKDVKNRYVYAPRFMNIAVKNSKETLSHYTKYLNKMTNSKDKIAIVDTISSGSLSSQTLLENVLNKHILGFYWSVEHSNDNYAYAEFRPNNIEHHKVFTKNWNFMEFLMTAPEHPIKGLDADGRPIYDKNPSKNEQIRSRVYPFVSDGAVDFAKDIIDIFGDIDIYFNEDVIIDWINYFCDFPTKIDIENMRHIQHAYDAEHSKYIPLFVANISLLSIFLHPIKTKKLLKQSKWKTPMQNAFLILLSPIKIKINGIKRIRIFLFPKLKHKLFGISLCLFDNYIYQFVIGKQEEL